MCAKQHKLCSILIFFIISSMPNYIIKIHANEGCPYTFAHGHNITNLCVANVTSGSSVQIMLCCEEVYGAAVYAIAQYANRTGGMFLEATEAENCISSYKRQLMEQRGLDNTFFRQICPLPPSRITSYASPCNFADMSELLHAESLQKVSGSCGDDLQSGGKGCQACQAQLLQATVSLAEHKLDQPGACGTAIAIALTSLNPNPQYFDTFYTCVLQILGGVPISQYLNITTAAALNPIAGQTLHNDRTTNLSASALVIVVATVLGIVLLLCLLLAGFYVVRRRKMNSNTYNFPNDIPASGLLSSEKSEGILPTEGFYIFTLKELIKATNRFNNALLLGQGSAGKVYIGQLPSGKAIAVKRILTEKKVETFYKEVELLARIRHPNLTALLGYCQTKHVHLLVYEYMSNGDLAQKLLTKDGPTLTWNQRIQIAIDCAKGLTYLHECPEGPIVHRDIKPTNILLNEAFEAKLSDFGLSKIIESDASHVSTEIKGTTGYLDPEYLILGQLTEASDVYSFGIVLLQLISGRKAIDTNHPHQAHRSIVHMAMSAVGESGNLSDLSDPRLENQISLPAFKKLAEVAHKCVQPRSYDRPSISEVLDDLQLTLRLAKLYPPPSYSCSNSPPPPSTPPPTSPPPPPPSSPPPLPTSPRT